MFFCTRNGPCTDTVKSVKKVQRNICKKVPKSTLGVGNPHTVTIEKDVLGVINPYVQKEVSKKGCYVCPSMHTKYCKIVYSFRDCFLHITYLQGLM
jgi:hypothetical protein